MYRTFGVVVARMVGPARSHTVVTEPASEPLWRSATTAGLGSIEWFPIPDAIHLSRQGIKPGPMLLLRKQGTRVTIPTEWAAITSVGAVLAHTTKYRPGAEERPFFSVIHRSDLRDANAGTCVFTATSRRHSAHCYLSLPSPAESTSSGATMTNSRARSMPHQKIHHRAPPEAEPPIFDEFEKILSSFPSSSHRTCFLK